MDHTVKVGEFDIIASGNIINSNNEPIEIKIANLCFRFTFFIDNGGIRYTSNVVNNTTIEFQLFNLQSAVPSGTIDSIHLGHLNNRKLYFRFYCDNLVFNKGFTFNYMFYLGGQNV